MGQLIPQDFTFETLKNDAERVVVRAFADTLREKWLVIPDVGIRDDARDSQTDIVLIHPDMGVIVVEVKSHRIAIREGIWHGEKGYPLDPQPVDQVQRYAYKLREFVRTIDDSLAHFDIGWGVALPNSPAIDGDLTPDIKADQVLLAGAMEDANAAVERMAIAAYRYNAALDGQAIEAIVRRLRPTTDFKWNPEAITTYTRERLAELCEAQISSLTSLLHNRRVIVRGGAGTGKTFLGIKWARQAWSEDDRVLLTCYNDPLASSLKEQFGIAIDESVKIDSFYELALGLEGMPPLERPNLPPDEMGEWWDTVATGHIIGNWDKVGEYFDTIIIDEAQDFSPTWIALLESLLDPDGRRRMLLLADEGQGVYSRGFVFPQADDGWVQVELASNFRNAHPIAHLLRRGLGGAPSPVYSPEGLGIHFYVATDIDNVTSVVEAEIDRIVEDDERSAASIGVVTLDRETRDELRKRLDLVAWEDRGDGAVVCETFRRAKGLEFDTVILIAMMPEDAAEVTPLYIGVSRAVSELIVVGSAEVADRLGLA